MKIIQDRCVAQRVSYNNNNYNCLNGRMHSKLSAKSNLGSLLLHHKEFVEILLHLPK